MVHAQQLDADGQQVREPVERLEALGGTLGRLGEREVGDRPDEDRAREHAIRETLGELTHGTVARVPEGRLWPDLGDQVVVVRVEPLGHLERQVVAPAARDRRVAREVKATVGVGQVREPGRDRAHDSSRVEHVVVEGEGARDRGDVGAQAEPGKARYQYPAAVEPAAPSPDPLSEAEAVEAFGTLLHGIVSARPTAGDQVAVELSGGMDSATVASALANAYGVVASRGILLGGDERDAQVKRREKIVQRLGLLDETVDIDAYLPSLDLQPGERKVYPHAELYLEAFDRLWGSARAQGRRMLFTGVGGDELFPTYRQEATCAVDAGGALIGEARNHAVRLLTPRAQDALGASRLFDAPASPLPVSSLLASSCQAPHLLRHGLWPVNPLSDPRLVAFCYRLAPQRRHGRATMRGFLRERLGGDVFPPDYAKETFACVLPSLISRQVKAVAAQLRECALADLGLVDRRAALDLLGDVATTRGDAAAAPLISFLWLERFVRQLA